MDLEELQARVGKLEAENRRFRFAAISILLAMCAGVWLGEASPQKRVIEGEQVVLQDSLKNDRAVLEVTQAGVSLRFMDERGRKRLALGCDDASSGLYLFDRDSAADAFLAVLKGEPRLTFWDGTGQGRVNLQTSKDETTLKLWDSGQRSSIEAIAGAKATRLTVRDAEGRVRLVKP